MISKRNAVRLVSCFLIKWVALPALAQYSMSPEIVVSNLDLWETTPDVAFNTQRGEYLAVWTGDSTGPAPWIGGKRYTDRGELIEEFVIAVNNNPPLPLANKSPAVAYDPLNDRFLVVWSHDLWGDENYWEVRGRLIPGDGPSPSFSEFGISNTMSHSIRTPRVAFATTQQQFIVVWEAYEPLTSNHYGILAHRVSPDGALPGSLVTVAAGAVGYRYSPDVAYNPTRNEYLIVFTWRDHNPSSGNILGVRMNANGAVLGGGEFNIATWPDDERFPAVASLAEANEWAVVWQSDTTKMNDVYSRRLSVDGAGVVQLATPVQVRSTVLDEVSADISSYPGESGYMISWAGQYSNASGPFGIIARTLNTSNVLGTLLYPRPIYIGEDVSCSAPTLANGAGSFFFAWTHDRDGIPTYKDIHGRLLFDYLFKNGFESGNTSAWSGAVG